MKVSSALLALLSLSLPLVGFETQGLVPAGVVAGATASDHGLTVRCADGTTVQLGFLAPDLVRIRACFQGQDCPPADHSWAIEKRDWAAVPATLRESDEGWSYSSACLEVRIRKSPFLISFVDKATGKVINADERPLARDPATGRVAAFKRLGFDEHFYGIGERANHLDRRRGEFQFWNSDTPGYVEGTDPLYQSIPFYVGLEEGRAYGLFYDNSFKASIDFGHTGQDYAGFCAEGGVLDYYFFAGPSVKDIVSRYSELTGRMPLPPLWAMGHHQCRYSYYPDSVVEKVADTYRSHDLPLDAVYLDIHYMDGYRSFTFDAMRFPDPKALMGRLADKGVHVVTIVDPGIKYQPHGAGESGYHAYDQGVAGDHFLKRKNGTPYIGQVWPGKAVFADYTRPETRRWWGDLHADFLNKGVAGFWNDMNEPSDFVDKSGASQADVLFEDGGRHSSYLENRNLFAMLMSRATFEGYRRLRPDARPFIITRAGYAGIQRYAVTWTGDNNATWESLAMGVSMFESMGLSGQAFVGADLPGFIGRGDGELLARCYQVACFSPLFRNHGAVDGYDHEPWRYGPQYEAIVRKYIKLRYQLLPYLYTGIEEAHRDGLPVFRPLLMNFQEDPAVLNLDDEFMVGEALLAAPILRAGERGREVYLPAATWYDFWTGHEVKAGFGRFEAPLDHLPLFVRGGSIIPSTVPMNYVHEKAWSPLGFDIWPDAKGDAAGSLYEDDGDTQAYQQDQCHRSFLAFRRDGKGYRLELTVSGKAKVGARQLIVRFHGLRQAPEAVLLDGRSLNASTDANAEGWTWDDAGTLLLRLQDQGQAHSLLLR